MKLPKILTLDVISLKVASNDLLKKASNSVAIPMRRQTRLQHVMCRSEAVEDETNLIRTTRYVILGPVGINDFEPIRLVIVIPEGKIACLSKSAEVCYLAWSFHEPHRGTLADQDEWLLAVY